MVWLRKWWVIVILIVLTLYSVLVIYRVFVIAGEEKTAKAVERIHGSALAMADVTGENLPPRPSVAEAGRTVEGVDVNENGIRDDVEHAIFDKYPNDIKIRAALLQYAKALQMEFTEVVNSETLVAVMQQQGRASECAYGYDKDTVEKLVFDTKEKENFREEIRRKFMISYALLNTEGCDLSL